MARRENLRMQSIQFWHGAFRRALTLLGQMGRDEEKHLLSYPYQVRMGRKGGKRAIASSPGEPPRRRTGQLQSSIGYDVFSESGRGYVARIGARAGHKRGPVLRWLEGGTVKMRPRPSLRIMLRRLVHRIVPTLKAQCRQRGFR